MDATATLTATEMATAVAMAVGTVAVLFFLLRRRSQSSPASTFESKSKSKIPAAPGGGTWLLGHALRYKADPPGFLRASAEATGGGGLLEINLAGRRMVIVTSSTSTASSSSTSTTDEDGGDGDEDAMRTVATLPESVCSARHAVAEIGFEYLLGNFNVYWGTDVQKRVLKNALFHPLKWQHRAPLFCDSLRRHMLSEVEKRNSNNGTAVVSLLPFIRRVTILVVVEQFLGDSFLEGDNWIDEFMAFQDRLEDATAAGAVLPRFVAVPLVYRPVAKQRRHLEETIATMVRGAMQQADTAKMGFWLAEILDESSELPPSASLSINQISQLIVGLLFAAHKNVAIGAAQSYLFFVEHQRQQKEDTTTASLSHHFQLQCKDEARRLVETPTAAQLEYSASLSLVCLECLRLTAHTIGAIRTAQRDIHVVRRDHGNIDGNPTTKKCPVTIPKGTTIGISHICPHLSNTDAWGPTPSRYSPEQRELEKFNDEYAFTTFSHGTHRCPGKSLAVAMIQYTIALLIDQYDVDFVDPTNVPPVSFERATLAQRSGPVLVRIKPRKETRQSI